MIRWMMDMNMLLVCNKPGASDGESLLEYGADSCLYCAAGLPGFEYGHMVIYRNGAGGFHLVHLDIPFRSFKLAIRFLYNLAIITREQIIVLLL